MEWNQYRGTYISVHYTERHFGGTKYVDLHVVPYIAAIGDSFLLTHGNAKSHTAQLVEYILETETI